MSTTNNNNDNNDDLTPRLDSNVLAKKLLQLKTRRINLLLQISQYKGELVSLLRELDFEETSLNEHVAIIDQAVSTVFY